MSLCQGHWKELTIDSQKNWLIVITEGTYYFLALFVQMKGYRQILDFSIVIAHQSHPILSTAPTNRNKLPFLSRTYARTILQILDVGNEEFSRINLYIMK